MAQVEDRPLFNQWAVKQGADGVKRYWASKNQEGIDGPITDIGARSG